MMLQFVDRWRNDFGFAIAAKRRLQIIDGNKENVGLGWFFSRDWLRSQNPGKAKRDYKRSKKSARI